MKFLLGKNLKKVYRNGDAKWENLHNIPETVGARNSVLPAISQNSSS